MSKFLQNIFALGLLLLPLTAFSETNFTFNGDLRFRTEQSREEQASPLPDANQFRQRLRVRAGGTAKINEKTDVTLRLATGSPAASESNGTNQTMTDYYSKKLFLLDLAYFNLKLNPDFLIQGGKTPLTFVTAGGSDLIYDPDLTPEGLAFKYKCTGNTADLFVNAGASWLSERFSASGATDNTDVGLIGGQIGFTKKFESWNFTLAAATYNFSNIKGATAPAAKENTLSGGAYANDYKLMAGDLEIGTTLASLPVTVFYEMVSNSEGGDYKNGGNIGIGIGRLKEVDSWTVRLDIKEVEKDAVVGILADSDSSGGGTDIRSTRLSGFYEVAENANVGLTLFAGQRQISSTTFTPDYSKAFLDFIFNF
jgi:hypothetical protein